MGMIRNEEKKAGYFVSLGDYVLNMSIIKSV
jgi:hypothetical protein